MLSDFRSDDSFPVKTGSGRKIMVDPHSNRIRKVEAGKSACFYLLTANSRFKPEITGKTGSNSKVAVRPRIRRELANFLIKILGTIP